MSEEIPISEELPEEISSVALASQPDPAPEQQDSEEEPADSEDSEQDQAYLLPFLIVGIGASAGGLEAYIDLFDNLAGDTGMAFVVVSHLSPDQKSRLSEILTLHTPMPVSELQERTEPKPNHVLRFALQHFCHVVARRPGAGTAAAGHSSPQAHRLFLPLDGGGSENACRGRGPLWNGF
jgi:chemotaxis response regulator CheB